MNLSARANAKDRHLRSELCAGAFLAVEPMRRSSADSLNTLRDLAGRSHFKREWLRTTELLAHSGSKLAGTTKPVFRRQVPN